MEGIDKEQDMIESVVRNSDESLTINFNQKVFIPPLSSNETSIEVIKAGLPDGVYLQVESAELGYSHVSAGSVRELITQNTGILGVVNIEELVDGRDRETDFELRNRYTLRVNSPLINTKDVIEQSVRNLRGVSQSLVFVGSKDNPNLSQGQIEVLVFGGDRDEIGQIIYLTKGLAETTGNESIIAYDLNRNPVVIKFSRPEVIHFDIRVNIIRNDSFRADGVESIRRIIQDYQRQFRLGSNLSPSPDIIYPLQAVEGISFLDIEISESGKEQYSDKVRNLNSRQVPRFNKVEVFENGEVL